MKWSGRLAVVAAALILTGWLTGNATVHDPSPPRWTEWVTVIGWYGGLLALLMSASIVIFSRK